MQELIRYETACRALAEPSLSIEHMLGDELPLGEGAMVGILPALSVQ
jgi:hypothetical protein